MLEGGLADAIGDVVGAKYLKMEHSVCFMDSMVFVIELPVAEHGHPEVKKAKI